MLSACDLLVRNNKVVAEALESAFRGKESSIVFFDRQHPKAGRIAQGWKEGTYAESHGDEFGSFHTHTSKDLGLSPGDVRFALRRGHDFMCVGAKGRVTCYDLRPLKPETVGKLKKMAEIGATDAIRLRGEMGSKLTAEQIKDTYAEYNTITYDIQRLLREADVCSLDFNL